MGRMMKAIKIITVVLAIAFLAIQFIPNKLPDNKAENQQDIAISGGIPENIAVLLKSSCYDCHSNQTHYPWYSKLAPSSWLLTRDINKGRKELNFSEWESYSKRHRIGKLEDIKEEITSGEMPLPAYRFIHRRSALSPGQVTALSNWTDEMTKKMLE
jgi:hypothetical protein